MSDTINAELAALDAEGAELDSMFDSSDGMTSTLKPQAVDQGDGSDKATEAVQKPQQDKPAKESDTKTAQAKTEQKPEPKAEETEDSDKGLTKYQKAQARAAKSWEKINAEKEAVAKERAEIAAERQRIAAEREAAEKAKPQEPAKPSPEQYEAFAKQAEAEGEFKQAALARQMAKERAAEIAQEQAKATAAKPMHTEAEFKAKQTQAYQAAVRDFPEIADPTSPLAQAVKQMVEHEAPVAELLQQNPYGLYFVTRFAKANASAALVPDLQKQVESLTAKIRGLETMTTPLKGQSVNTPLSETSFDDMSFEQQERELESMLSGR